jgi:hypothetical protein
MSPFLIPERWAWFVDFAGEVPVDDPYKRVGEIGVGSTPESLQASISEAMTAQFSPPRSQCRAHADRLGELTLPANERELFAQPPFEFGEKRTQSSLADGASLVRPRMSVSIR